MHALCVSSGCSSPSNTVTASVQTNGHRPGMGDEGQGMVLHEPILGSQGIFQCLWLRKRLLTSAWKVSWASVLWCLSVLLTVVGSVWMVSHPAPPHPWLAWYLCLHCHPGGASMQTTAQVPALSLWPALHSAHISVLFLRSVLEAVPFWVLKDTQLWLIPAKSLCYARMLSWVHRTPWRPYETITSLAAYFKGRTLKQREEKLLMQDHSGPGGKHSFRLQMPELHWLTGPVNISIVVGFS